MQRESHAKIAELESALSQKEEERVPGQVSAAEYDHLKRKYNDLFQSNASTCNTLKQLTQRYHLERQKWKKWWLEWRRDYDLEHADLHVKPDDYQVDQNRKKSSSSRKSRCADLIHENKENSISSGGKNILGLANSADDPTHPPTSPQRIFSPTQKTDSQDTVFSSNNIAFNVLADEPRSTSDIEEAIKDEPENSLFVKNNDMILLPNSYDLMTPAVRQIHEPLLNGKLPRATESVNKSNPTRHHLDMTQVDLDTPLGMRRRSQFALTNQLNKCAQCMPIDLTVVSHLKASQIRHQ